MNLLLLEPRELDDEGRVRLVGRRAEHLRKVLGVAAGQQLRAGRLNHERGTATVLHVDPREVQIRYQAEQVLSPPPPRNLLLAVPRPKVLSRCIEHASALGFSKIALFRSYRVDRSHLLSHKLDGANLHEHLLAGLEQSCRVHLPTVQVFHRFKPFVEDELQAWLQCDQRFVAHPQPGAPPAVGPSSQSYALAIGPEGGFVPYEVAALTERGVVAVSAATGPLRVESALSYFAGRLDAFAEGAGHLTASQS
jgi:RsmE family RNA methyltransferase